ncbi:hypothetical protein [Nocardia iowensis]|uniref:Uncharacterized protein n=1 Tax=Nocardia iowensis TaxID=204891 RepID=A0ABX8S2I1_NOCIO|nr:hypothetical protein [Nocardia iowensis]QXN94770.1 hypothetical protein KV110_18000 [Nocardia iowensis]
MDDYFSPVHRPWRLLLWNEDSERWESKGWGSPDITGAVRSVTEYATKGQRKRIVFIEEREHHRVGMKNYRARTVWEGTRLPSYFGQGFEVGNLDEVGG